MKPKIPPHIKQILDGVTNKRARVVIDHILKHGFVTTEDLANYGYNHPPRAARDVREEGIPLETFNVKSSDGRSIAAYRFGDWSQVNEGKLGGRKVFPKDLKNELYSLQAGKCAICSGRFESRYLQIDHRIPYEVGGEGTKPDRTANEFMLLDGACNRAKSWSCEHCLNWLEEKKPAICASCYWANPENYTHVAMQQARRLDLLWQGEEVLAFDELRQRLKQSKIPLPEYIKEVVRKNVKKS